MSNPLQSCCKCRLVGGAQLACLRIGVWSFLIWDFESSGRGIKPHHVPCTFAHSTPMDQNLVLLHLVTIEEWTSIPPSYVGYQNRCGYRFQLRPRASRPDPEVPRLLTCAPRWSQASASRPCYRNCNLPKN